MTSRWSTFKVALKGNGIFSANGGLGGVSINFIDSFIEFKMNKVDSLIWNVENLVTLVRLNGLSGILLAITLLNLSKDPTSKSKVMFI